MSSGLTIASQTIGFISFGFTLLTWLGVYVSLIKTARSAPTAIPLILSNLRQEIQAERSALRERIKEGDCYGVFPGRQMRRVGKNESHLKLRETTMKNLWKQFRELEREFIVHRNGDDNDLEGRGSEGDESQFEDVNDDGRKYYDEKGSPVVGRVRQGRRAMRRRDSHLRDRMGMLVGGLSTDRTMYYNTNIRHRILWWWKGDDIRGIQDQIQRLQIQRIEVDLYETDCLVKRGLAVLGSMSGDDPYEPCGEGRRNPSRGPTGSSGRRRRSYQSSHSAKNGRRSVPRSRNISQNGVREIYEKEIRRTRRRSDSRSPPSRDRSRSRATSSVSVGRYTGPRGRSQAPSVVEYEVVNPGRIWVDIENTSDTPNRTPGNMDRPHPAHFKSYLRERPSLNRMRRD